MRSAVLKTLKNLYEGKEVTAKTLMECGTTRITNEISTLRNTFSIAIETKQNKTKNKKWYGSYHLVHDKKNLEKVRDILGISSKKDEAQKSHD